MKSKENHNELLPKSIIDEYKLYQSIYKLVPPFLGQGAYGICCSAINKMNNTPVAIKKISLGSMNEKDINRVLREVRLARTITHVNVVKILDMFHNKTELYIVFEKMDTDLNKVICSGQKLTKTHVQFFVYQILKGLFFLHSADMIHRDIKPGNILLNKDCFVKICDFGLAKYSESQQHTKYVVTRWYRAPELLMKTAKYDKKIDVWSVGCILGEILKGKIIFKGKHYLEQLGEIIKVLGSPTKSDLDTISSREAFIYIKSHKKCNRVNFYEYFKNKFDNKDAIDLLEKMLVYSPKKRISVEEALRHPFFKELHDKFDEPTCVPQVKDVLTELEKNYEGNELKLELFKEILYYHPEIDPVSFLKGKVKDDILLETKQKIEQMRVKTRYLRQLQRNFNEHIKNQRNELQENDFLDDDM